MTGKSIPPPTDPNIPIAATAIGTDEWVAQIEGRLTRRRGLSGWLGNLWDAIPAAGRYGLVLLLLVLLPVISGADLALELIGVSNNDFIVRIGARFLIFAMLAIGLNVVVGYTGMLDLGYIAFFGIAGYLYAYMSSEFVQIEGLIPYGLAIPSLISLPLIIALVALIGWLLGAVSLRLVGDYLAIVTLGFGQVFLQVAKTATRVELPWRDRPVDFTRGPNGINNLDDISIFGYTFETTLQYYYLFLALVALLYLAVYRLNESRIGRAWRSIKEDELAAEVMGAPTRRLKLLAFALGAGIAALAGAVDAAWQGNVVPDPRYGVLTLINLYAMVVLGGLGSLPGVVVGAFIFTVLPEVLRNITLAGFLFYGVGLLGLYIHLKPLKRLAIVLGSTIVAGYLFKLLVNLIRPAWDRGYPAAGSVLNQIVQGWLVIPENYQVAGNVVVWVAIFLLLMAVLRRRAPWHEILLGLAIYALAFAWETRLAVEPAATRVLIVGVSLVVLMIARPQGLFGKVEVKVV